jgi:hypothetical protein
MRVSLTLPSDCPTCDGYCLCADDAPYCPSCAREKRLQDYKEKLMLNISDLLLAAPKPPLMAPEPIVERSTSYLVRLRDKHTGQSFEAAFNSMTERNLYIFETEHWAEVESEWTR